MENIAKCIVRHRNKILILAIALLIPSVFGYLNTKINYDILSYLPQDCESMKGQNILDEKYHLASVGIMVTNDLSDQEVVQLEKKMEAVDGVKQVFWRDDVLDISVPKEMFPQEVQQQLYSGDSTILIVTFDEDTASTRTMDAIQQIKQILE